MVFTAEVADITQNPLTIGLLCAISVVVNIEEPFLFDPSAYFLLL